MKKFLLGITMFILLWGGNLISVKAETEPCDHYWDEYKYEEQDNNYHNIIYKCLWCGAEKNEKVKHEWEIDWDYETYDYGIQYYNKDFHMINFTCKDCGAKKEEKWKHDWKWSDEYDNEDDYAYYNNSYHVKKYHCTECNGTLKGSKKEKHVPYYDDDGDVKKYATLQSKACISKECYKCGKSYKIYKTWKRNSYYSYSYNLSHSTVWNKNKVVKVKLKRASKGTVIKLKVGKKKYSYKVKNNKKTFKIKIKPALYGQKIKIELYYKGQKVGVDKCDDDDEVWYARKVKVGMTKKQVRYTWGAPESKSSSSGGWSYWFYGDGSYVGFKSGKVKVWYDGAA